MSNFAFLEDEKQFHDFAAACLEAEKEPSS